MHEAEKKSIKMKSHFVCLSMLPRWPQREGCRAIGGGRMECSWKTVLLLVCASLGVQYTAIRTLRDSLSGPCQGAYRCRSRHRAGTTFRQIKIVPHSVSHLKMCSYVVLFFKAQRNINNLNQVNHQHAYADIFSILDW